MMEKLRNKRYKNPFKVPENYFEDVNRKIISATSGNDHEEKKAGLYRRLRPYILIAASVTGFILLSYSAIKLLTPEKTVLKISEAQYEENPDSYLNEIDISTLEENASSVVLSEEGTGVSKADIIDYLLSDNLEINEIYEQL